MCGKYTVNRNVSGHLGERRVRRWEGKVESVRTERLNVMGERLRCRRSTVRAKREGRGGCDGE